MTIQMVLLPVFVQVALTFALLFWMASERTGSVARGETKMRDIALLKGSGYQVHRPTVFFLSDGQPTEKEARWRDQLEHQRKNSRLVQRQCILH